MASLELLHESIVLFVCLSVNLCCGSHSQSSVRTYNVLLHITITLYICTYSTVGPQYNEHFGTTGCLLY